MLEKILITGAAGMIGSHMIEALDTDESSQVIGTYYNSTIEFSDISGKCELAKTDMRYFKSVLLLLTKYKPDIIYHLAAQSYPSISWDKGQETLEINVLSTLHIFDAIIEIRKDDPLYDPIVVVACSSAQYGQTMIDADGPVCEKQPQLPLSPYGVSKVCQDLLAYQFFKSHRIKTIRARIFNTTGPRKTGDVLSDFIRRAVIKKHSPDFLFTVGNIDTVRSITDVRDLVNALILLARNGEYGEAYNICTDNKYTIRELLNHVEKASGIDLYPKVDSRLLRPIDEKSIIGDNEKLKLATGWEPQIPIEETVKDMLHYELMLWRKQNES